MSTAKLATLRAKIRRIDSELSAIADGNVRVPMDLALERVGTALDADRARAIEMIQGYAEAFRGQKHTPPPPPALSAWQLSLIVDPAAILTAMRSHLGEMYRDCETATPAAIAARCNHLRRERAEAECEEYRLADQLGEPQRADIDPNLLLGLEPEATRFT